MIPKASEAVSQSRSSLAALADCGAAPTAGAHGVELHAQGPLAWGFGLQQVCMSHQYANTFAARCFMACRGPLSWRDSIRLDSGWTLRLQQPPRCLPIVFRTTSVADDDSLTHKLHTTRYMFCEACNKSRSLSCPKRILHSTVLYTSDQGVKPFSDPEGRAQHRPDIAP